MTKAGEQAPRCKPGWPPRKSGERVQSQGLLVASAAFPQAGSFFVHPACHETTTSIVHHTFLTSLLLLTLLYCEYNRSHQHTHTPQSRQPASLVSLFSTSTPARRSSYQRAPALPSQRARADQYLSSSHQPTTKDTPYCYTLHPTATRLLALRHLLAMDSMRHLSSSLPGTRRRNEQPHQLLADFKAAALSVTNLYKTATAENARSREAGYQDALDDLLVFLDKENMGLMDGEGWRVRRWATERLDDAPKGSEDEEDGSKEEAVETRSSSPEVQRKVTVPAASSSLLEEEHQRPAS